MLEMKASAVPIPLINLAQLHFSLSVFRQAMIDPG